MAVGTPIDVERQLGISDRTSFRLDRYLAIPRQTYSVNTQVSARFDAG